MPHPDCDAAIADFEDGIKNFAAAHVQNNYLKQLSYSGLAATWLACKGNPDKAIEVASEAIRKIPEQPNNYLNRGIAYFDKREFDLALKDYGEALARAEKIAPAERAMSKANIFNSIGVVWMEKRDFDRASVNFENAVRLAPKSSLYLANRGKIWRLKGYLDQALADQTRALELNPDTLIERTERGNTFRYRGQLDEALADYNRASQLSVKRQEGEYAPAATGRGLAYEKMGNLELAHAEFLKALSSQNPERDVTRDAIETARAHLAAFESGEPPPVIPDAPIRVTNSASVPTPKIAAPILNQPLARERVQSTSVKQGRRVALVVGNSAYVNVPPLTNPKNDADAVAKSLRNIGFDKVTLVEDATREKLIDALRTFANDAEASDWAMVYYAGHGMEIGGVNYLIPIDAKLAVDRDIEYETVALSQVLRGIGSARKIKLVVLDACRDNPFAPRKTETPEVIARELTVGGTIVSRSTNGRGLAEVKVTGATLVVFAAKDGQVALDGEGSNSPFAVAVVQRLATPGVEINKVFRLVRDDVMEATAGRQEPYTYGSLPGKEDFFFVAGK